MDKSITITGVNDTDLSKESELAVVRKAISEGIIEYRVGDLDSIDLSTEKYALVTCYETLIHNDNKKILSILQRLLDTVKPMGRLYANLNPAQRIDPKITEFIEKVRDNQNTIFEYEKDDESGDKRIFMMIRKTL